MYGFLGGTSRLGRDGIETPGMIRWRLVGRARLGDNGLGGLCLGWRGRMGSRCRRELAHPNRGGGSGLVCCQRSAVVADDERAVQALLNLDTGTRVADTIWAGRDLQPFAVERDGVVVADGTVMFEAEDLLGLQPFRPGAVD